MVLPPSMQGLLPAGWLAFAGRELNPLDHVERFQIIFSSPSPGFFLAQRTAGFPRYGWKAGIWSSTFPRTTRLKPAPGIHRLMFGLCLHFAHVEATSVIPHCVGRGARACAAMEVG
jgi:hypothetical protein